ncbi:MAG: beta-N-acetylhexosaminidase [Gammaproteobacteria bacterium]|nr:beta-N-acetylhexosaminidase [Gammaproteobacteria bacterium]NNJ78750.1 beta-N-acetylhexosaminidase [Xanthomonadales bacterium]
MSTAGPVLIGLPGHDLDEEGRRRLAHPAVGGVVLFRRNFKDLEQLQRLVDEIRRATEPRPLIGIDQEGGRVQRLEGEGFTRLPPLGVLGRLHAVDPVKALDMAYRHGRVMATEMLACGIDLSFAPVLDLDRGSRVIGDRAFGSVPGLISTLGRSYLAGMRDAGMKSTGKHFPGHGSVVADSHVDDVTDPRPLTEIRETDLVPFRQLMPELDAMMIAHVLYPSVDSLPAGYSSTWLRDILRGELGFEGVIVSDDLGMHAAKAMGGVRQRAEACLGAGCDLVLVCHPEDVDSLLADHAPECGDASSVIGRLYGVPTVDRGELAEVVREGIREWGYWRQSLERLGESWA